MDCLKKLISMQSALIYKSQDPIPMYIHVHKKFINQLSYELVSTNEVYKVYLLPQFNCILCSSSEKSCSALLLHLRLVHCEFKIRYANYFYKLQNSKSNSSLHIFISDKRRELEKVNPKEISYSASNRSSNDVSDSLISEMFKQTPNSNMLQSIHLALNIKEDLKQIKRVYYHSLTGIPFTEEEVNNEVDSDIEDDSSWVAELEAKEINEDPYLHQSDKAMFLLWNRYMDLHYPQRNISNADLTQHIIKFMKDNSEQVVILRANFHQFLITLMELRNIDEADLVKIELEYKSIARSVRV
jgi:hypothetical protein